MASGSTSAQRDQLVAAAKKALVDAHTALAEVIASALETTTPSKADLEVVEKALEVAKIKAETPALSTAETSGGKKKQNKHRGGATSAADAANAYYVQDVSNVGDLVHDDHAPTLYASSGAVNNLLNQPSASTADLRISDNSANMLSGTNSAFVDPPLWGGAKQKVKKLKSRKSQ